MDTLTNVGGCDSIVTLNLTINTVDTTVTVSDPNISANAAGALYQWLDCDSSYAIIIGETANNFTALSNGNYAVEVTENGCVDTSSCITILSVGINMLNSVLNQIAVFPNPSTGLVNIDLNNLTDASIKVFNITGKLIYQENEINSSPYQFELNASSGVYIIEINTNQKKQFFKLIKN